MVEFYNFLPTRQIEAALGLQARLRQRIEEIHQAIGEDAAILEPGEKLNEEALFAIYEGRADALDTFEAQGESFGLEEAEEIIRALKNENPALFQRIANLPKGARSGLAAPTSARAFVFCAAGSFTKLLLVDETGGQISDDPSAALALIKADEATPRLEPPPGFNDLIASVRRAFAKEVEEREANQRTLRKTPAQRYVLQRLEEDRKDLRSESDLALVDHLRDLFTRNWGSGVERRLKLLARDRYVGKKLFEALSATATDFNLHARAGQVADQPTAELPLVVCADYLAN